MKVSLVVAEGAHQGKIIPIKLAKFVIGRDPQCHLRPSSASISKRHCVIVVKGDRVILRDLESTNGTFVNDQPLQGPTELHDEDRLKIGPLAFTVKLESGVSVDKPTPLPPPAASSEEDEIAAMLLDLRGEGGADSGGLADPNKISTDSTVLDMMAPAPAEGSPDQAGSKAKNEKAKLDANTSQAAKAILEKYLRRPRA
jgi:pSer/pThr/pTyr-binding forkhead associated (FHA) protein